ncbi:hypothetical protein ACFWVP_05930 [Streptomyces sp. NPDC058637]|uniref:hypothetical protein n=1 Tax=Streptomyces sp. NPDC058637 TaxID=3346569 RepID=UPI003667B47E
MSVATDPSTTYGILLVEATRLMKEFRYTSDVLPRCREGPWLSFGAQPEATEHPR